MDITWRSFETGGVLVEVAVDMDVSELPTLETGFVVIGMVIGEGGIVVTTIMFCPYSFLL